MQQTHRNTNTSHVIFTAQHTHTTDTAGLGETAANWTWARCCRQWLKLQRYPATTILHKNVTSN